MKLKRKKVGDRKYQLVDNVTGEVIATAAQTGEHGRDNYPWEWSMENGKIFAKLNAATGQSADALKTCVDYVESYANSYGILRYVKEIDPLTVKAGDVFRFHGLFYRAIDDAIKEDNVLIRVFNYKGERTWFAVQSDKEVALFQ
jgi:hypothetical protein